MSETELGNADTMAMMEEAANLILQAKNDEMKISQLVDSIELGDEDASILGQIQSWFSPRVAVSCRIIGPAKMIAKIASKALGKPISFLNILMHECDATIAQWDGEGDPPPPLAFPNLYGNPLNQWYGRVEKARREQLEGFMAEEKQCLPAAGADGSLSTWKKYIRLGRSVYKRLRHALPAGTTQEAVHTKFIEWCGSAMSEPELERKLKTHLSQLVKEKYPSRQTAAGQAKLRVRDENGKVKSTASSSTKAHSVGTKATVAAKRTKTAGKKKPQTATRTVTRSSKPKRQTKQGKSHRQGTNKKQAASAAAIRSEDEAEPHVGIDYSSLILDLSGCHDSDVEEIIGPTLADAEDSEDEATRQPAEFRKPSTLWIKHRMYDVFLLQDFTNFMYWKQTEFAEPTSLIYDGFGVSLGQPKGISKANYCELQDHHFRLVSLAIGLIELEERFYDDGIKPDERSRDDIDSDGLKLAVMIASISADCVKASVKSWSSAHYNQSIEDVVSQVASFGMLLVQPHLSDSSNQLSWYRQLMRQCSRSLADETRLVGLARSILLVYSKFGRSEPIFRERGQILARKLLVDGAALFVMDEGQSSTTTGKAAPTRKPPADDSTISEPSSKTTGKAAPTRKPPADDSTISEPSSKTIGKAAPTRKPPADDSTISEPSSTTTGKAAPTRNPQADDSSISESSVDDPSVRSEVEAKNQPEAPLGKPKRNTRKRTRKVLSKKMNKPMREYKRMLLKRRRRLDNSRAGKKVSYTEDEVSEGSGEYSDSDEDDIADEAPTQEDEEFIASDDDEDIQNGDESDNPGDEDDEELEYDDEDDVSVYDGED